MPISFPCCFSHCLDWKKEDEWEEESDRLECLLHFLNYSIPSPFQGVAENRGKGQHLEDAGRSWASLEEREKWTLEEKGV